MITRTAAASTASLPTAKAFLRGEQAYHAERYADTVSAFRAATAARLSALLSEHDRLMVTAHAALSGGDPRRAYLLYRAAGAAYPDNAEAWYELGELMLRDPSATGGTVGQTRHALERVLALAPQHLGALVYLARMEAAERGPEARIRLEHLVERAETIRPNDARTRETRMLQVFAHGDDAAQRAALDHLRSSDDAIVWELAWKVASHTHRLDPAERIVRLLHAPGRPMRTKALAHTALAKLHQARGRPAMAEQELRTAGQVDASLEAHARAAQGHERWAVADSLHAVGRVPEAVDAYTALINDIGYDAAYLAPARLRRPELYDRSGHRAEAIEDYRRFLELWLDAEPPLRPTVVRVEQRLRELALP